MPCWWVRSRFCPNCLLLIWIYPKTEWFFCSSPSPGFMKTQPAVVSLIPLTTRQRSSKNPTSLLEEITCLRKSKLSGSQINAETFCKQISLTPLKLFLFNGYPQKQTRQSARKLSESVEMLISYKHHFTKTWTASQLSKSETKVVKVTKRVSFKQMAHGSNTKMKS